MNILLSKKSCNKYKISNKPEYFILSKKNSTFLVEKCLIFLFVRYLLQPVGIQISLHIQK